MEKLFIQKRKFHHGDTTDFLYSKYVFYYNGKEYETEDHSYTFHSELKEGEQVEIYVNPNNPNETIPPGKAKYEWIYLLGTIIFLLMIFVF